MATEIKIFIEETKEIIESIRIRTTPMRFIIYRGRLLERRMIEHDIHYYVEHSYIEIA